MGYIGLGSRATYGAADATGNNHGNWTVSFTPDIINVNVPHFEVHKIVVHGAAGSTFNVYVDQYEWDTSIQGYLNSWDPVQPLQLNPGNTLYFYYSDAITDNIKPKVTIWLRYDTSLYGRILG